MVTCKESTCERPAKVRGWCQMHYHRVWRRGSPEDRPRPKRLPCSIDGCNRPTVARGWCQSHWRRWKRRGDPLSPTPPRRRRDIEERFWEKVDRSDSDGCWPWIASVDPNWGYGWFRVTHNETMKKAHRVAWTLTRGELGEDEQVLHRCDNPPCCRPDHLFKGSHQDNMADRGAKGRESHKRCHHGEETPNHKLTEAEVTEIRARYEVGGIYQRELADEYGVSKGQVSRIVRGERWNADGDVPRRTWETRKGWRANPR